MIVRASDWTGAIAGTLALRVCTGKWQRATHQAAFPRGRGKREASDVLGYFGCQDEIALRQTVDLVRPGRDLDFPQASEMSG